MFGTDGIRGLSGVFPVSDEGATRVGAAVARVLKKNTPSPLVAVGRDTRKCGAKLQDEVCAGLAGAGARVVCADVCPTPAIVSLIRETGADGAIMVSASHNPPEYNGFKIFNSEGLKIPKSVETEITDAFEAAPERGRPAVVAADWKIPYGASLGGIDLSGVKAALDCANGAMFEIAPAVFEKTGAILSLIGCDPDNGEINTGCGSLQTDSLGEEVRRSGAALGAALDGDGDRVAFCCESGADVDGDRVIALFARELLENNTLKKPLVVATVMSNKGLEIFLEQIGIGLVRTDVGDRNVANEMRKQGINFGGEKSGHLIFSNYSNGGDGLLASLLATEVVKKKEMPLSEIVPQFDLFPQVLKNVQISSQKPFDSIPGLSKLVSAHNKILGKAGRIHLRYSGTEPLARVLVEGENGDVVHTVAEEIAEVLNDGA